MSASQKATTKTCSRTLRRSQAEESKKSLIGSKRSAWAVTPSSCPRRGRVYPFRRPVAESSPTKRDRTAARR
jgi:hypothetical protein